MTLSALPRVYINLVPVFNPASTFEKHYCTAVESVEAMLKEVGLTARIRDKFVRLALEREHGSAAQAHLRQLSEHQEYWCLCHNEVTCLVCVARESHGSNTLTCGHKLCDPCVEICGLPSIDQPRAFEFSTCPLCGQIIDDLIRLRPRTAGIRMLEFGGPADQKENMWSFLKTLQTVLALPCSLREHFDVVFGYDVGKCRPPLSQHDLMTQGPTSYKPSL